jgi:two-component system sensor histidine kinase YesM
VMGIVKKMIIGYFLLVFIPTTVLGITWYVLAENRLTDEYDAREKELMEHTKNNVSTYLGQIEGSYQLFQYNSYVIDYLNDMFTTDLEKIYSFKKYIRPMFKNVYLGNPRIESVTIYKTGLNGSLQGPEFKSLAEWSEKDKYTIDGRLTGDWIIRSNDTGALPEIKFVQMIHTSNFSKVIGILEITLKKSTVENLLESMKSDHNDNLLIMDQNNKLIYGKGPNASLNEFSHTYQLNQLNVNVVVSSKINHFNQDMEKQIILIVCTIIVLLVILTGLYYQFTSLVTKRIIRLARHMRTVENSQFPKFPITKGNDEISFLILSFNDMVHKMDEMVNQVYHAKLLQKEATYMALQAQIKPHFLYNTLESVRMLSEVGDSQKVSKLIYALGRLLRYNIPKDNIETTLKQELENVNSYIDIHKLRIGDRLSFELYVEENLDHLYCPPFILQPLVENCMVHGLSKTTKPFSIGLRITSLDHLVVVTLVDDGPGISKERLVEINKHLEEKENAVPLSNVQMGIGLKNVHERIKSYYGNEARLFIQSEQGAGTEVKLILRRSEEHAFPIDS